MKRYLPVIVGPFVVVAALTVVLLLWGNPPNVCC